jgi:hypothetical protein
MLNLLLVGIFFVLVLGSQTLEQALWPWWLRCCGELILVNQ